MSEDSHLNMNTPFSSTYSSSRAIETPPQQPQIYVGLNYTLQSSPSQSQIYPVNSYYSGSAFPSSVEQPIEETVLENIHTSPSQSNTTSHENQYNINLEPETLMSENSSLRRQSSRGSKRTGNPKRAEIDKKYACGINELIIYLAREYDDSIPEDHDFSKRQHGDSSKKKFLQIALNGIKNNKGEINDLKEALRRKDEELKKLQDILGRKDE